MPPPGGSGPKVPTELLNIALLERVALAVEKISKTIDKVVAATGTLETHVEKTSDIAEKSAKNVDAALLKIHEKLALGTEELEKQQKQWEKNERMVKRFGEAAKNAMNAFASGDVQGIATSLANAIPGGGGLLGLVFMGAKQNAEYSAQAHKALAGLRGLGYDGSKYVGQVTGEIRKMDDAWGTMGAEITATMNEFSKMSLGREQFAKASQTAQGFAGDIRGTATAIDLLNNVQPGTTAKLIGETMKTAATSVGEASNQVFEMTARLRELHVEYGMFGQGIVQASSALRLQNQSLSDTVRIFGDLQKGLRERGMTDYQSKQLALTGVQAGMQAIGGLSEGMQGFLAQQFAARGVEGFKDLSDPAALITQFQFGMTGGKGGAFAGNVFNGLRDMAVQAAGARPGESNKERENRQIFALEKIGGMPPEAARAIIITGKASLDQLDPAKATAHHIEGLDKAFSDYSEQFNSFDAMMRKMRHAIGDIGIALVHMIFPAIKLIANLLERLWLFAKELWGGGLSKDEKTRQELLSEQTDALFGDITAGSDEFVSAFDKFAHQLGSAVGAGGSARTRYLERQLAQVGKDTAGKDAAALKVGGDLTPEQQKSLQAAWIRGVAEKERATGKSFGQLTEMERVEASREAVELSRTYRRQMVSARARDKDFRQIVITVDIPHVEPSAGAS